PTLRDTIMVNADDCGCEVFVPNAITPNGSGLNDLFYPVFACGVSDYRLLVFDRWGNLLWESHDPAAGWNGTYKGNACQEDVYVYRITGWLDTGSNLIYYSKLGHVTIVR
ncbi:MAG TPA: gliding motility-associated C-terminal domain-containing protein, partial [Bacteroidia bacterium]|nr:gliding motility-associated C-terminal domain-containing protein [Bacteroidia bacterium]